MDFGIFDHVETKLGASTPQLYAERLELARLADQVGCFCYHVSEHHGTPLSVAPSPNILLAAMAAQTTRLRLGPLGALLPLHDPLRLVQEICMLDNLSEGRLEMGLGRGVNRIEMKFFGVDFDTSRARFDEALEVILRGLTQPTLQFEGEFYDYDNIPMEIAPLQKPYPPMWYPTSNMNSVEWVAKSGFHAIFAGELEHIAQQVQLYRETIDPALLPHRKYGIHPYVVVGETVDEAMTVGEEAYRTHHENLAYLNFWQGRNPADSMTRKQNLSAPPTLREAVEKGWAVAGSPEVVTDQLHAILDKTGCNYVLYTPLSGNAPLTFAMRGLELFATKVLPAL
jgi:alkanesulfonate monooxygenase SsuD/methylene tetrahydromethanopterin reductase-like flavin-dependent oxidoreductase (luciferase family)